MASENVTVSLPAETIKKARHLAVDRGMSLSKLVAEIIEEKLGSSTSYEEAQSRALAQMREGYPLNLNERTWTRDDLHER